MFPNGNTPLTFRIVWIFEELSRSHTPGCLVEVQKKPLLRWFESIRWLASGLQTDRLRAQHVAPHDGRRVVGPDRFELTLWNRNRAIIELSGLIDYFVTKKLCLLRDSFAEYEMRTAESVLPLTTLISISTTETRHRFYRFPVNPQA